MTKLPISCADETSDGRPSNGAIALSKKRVIVKRLNTILNFGTMDVLCADKTGTLTQNRIALSLHLDMRGEDSERLLEYAYLNSHFQSGLRRTFCPARIAFGQAVRLMTLSTHCVTASWRAPGEQSSWPGNGLRLGSS